MLAEHRRGRHLIRGEYEYDDQGRLVAVDRLDDPDPDAPWDGAHERRWRREFAPAGHVSMRWEREWTDPRDVCMTSLEGSVETLCYFDGAGRIIARRDESTCETIDRGPRWDRFTREWGYDDAGRVTHYHQLWDDTTQDVPRFPAVQERYTYAVHLR